MRNDIGTAIGTSARAADPLVRLIDELSLVVSGLTDEQYVRRPVGVMPSSVGSHVRHWLDHVVALRASAETGQLNYDQRQRGTPVESDRRAAMSLMSRLSPEIAGLTADCLARPIEVEVLLSDDGTPQTFQSSVGRELAYVVSHSVHHNAILGAMVQTLGGTVPPRFGYAPSTIAHASRRQSEGAGCAR
jgi:uncharacterized damage-inducible protein DinB